MKNFLKFLTLSVLGAVLIISCAKEELKEMKTVDTDQAEERIAPLPDLVVTKFVSSLPKVGTPCSNTERMGFAGCGGGTTPPTFKFSALVENIGTADVPANSNVDIRWNLFTGGGTNTTITQAIPAGGSVVISAGPYTLPCPTGPIQYDVIHWWANIDDSGFITESNENNNISPRLKMCDDL